MLLFIVADLEKLDVMKVKFSDAACTHVSPEYLSVKKEVAREQLKIIDPPPDVGNEGEDTPPPSLSKHFSMDTKLDNERCSREIKNYVDEIAPYLMNLPNAETSIRVTIDISIPEGVSQNLKETVEKIAPTLESTRNIFTLSRN